MRIKEPTFVCDRCDAKEHSVEDVPVGWHLLTDRYMTYEWDICTKCWNDLDNFLSGLSVGPVER